MRQKQEPPPASPGPAQTPRIVSPMEIQQKEFGVSRFGGYRMREVDEFLDELTETVQALLAEQDRLRRQAGASPVVGDPDLEDVGRQADEIIQRARDEAATILAEARERAATMAGASAAGAAAAVTSEQERAAVNAFLQQEKDFLQSLAALVQGHAESVKGMARKARSAPVAKQAEPEAPTATEPKAAEPGAGGPGPQEPEAKEPEAKEPEEKEPEVTQAMEPPIKVVEPEPAGAKRSESDRPEAADESLRELFWGEES